jgi:ATP-dependent Zn protease
MFDGVSKAADHQMQLFLGERYQRLQTSLESASDDMDDASEENIRNLKRTARELINANEAVLEQFFEIDAGNAQPWL